MYVLSDGGIGGWFGLAGPQPGDLEKFQSIVAQIRAQLERRFQDENDPRLLQRRRELAKLFAAVPPPFARTLHDQLRSQDPLGRLFHYRLATATRNQLLGILLKIPSPAAPAQQAPVPPQPTPVPPGPPVRGPIPGPWWPIPRPPFPPPGPQPPQPQPPEPIFDPGLRPPTPQNRQIPPKDILTWAERVRQFLKDNGGDQSLIDKLGGLLLKASAITGLAGAALGLFVFVNGELVQVVTVSDFVVQRILHRFLTSGMKEELERILRDLLDPKTTNAVENEIRRLQQPRGPGGKFEKRQPGQEPPGSAHEDEVCRRVRQRFPFFAEQVRVKRYAPRMGFPGQPPPAGLALSDPLVKVDCVGARSPTKGLVLFEAKESEPPDFSNPGLTAGQKIVYPELLKFGGEIVVSNGPFRAGTVLPKGTRVRIITPSNLNSI